MRVTGLGAETARLNTLGGQWCVCLIRIAPSPGGVSATACPGGGSRHRPIRLDGLVPWHLRNPDQLTCVSRLYMPELRRCPVHPPALPYPNRGVVWRSIQSVFTRLLTPLIASFFFAPQDMCICMLSLVSPSLRCALFFPRGDANRIQGRLESPCTCSYSLVQPGPVPKYRFYCLSARDTVLPYSL